MVYFILRRKIMRRKLLISILIVALLTVLFATLASADEPIKIWDISATENDNVIAYLYNDESNVDMYTLAITGIGNMKNWE